MVEGSDPQRTPLDDVDHLARSPHRSTVLERFARDDWTRRALYEETGIPQPTLGRILGSFQARGWLERSGGTYSLTHAGRALADEFTRLLDLVETLQRLPGTADLGPLFELGFQSRWLAAVDVTTAEGTDDAYAHIRRARESVRSADRIRELSPGPMPGMAEVIADRVHAGALTIETVFPRDPFEAFVEDREQRALIRGMLETGHLDLVLIDEAVPCYVARQGERAAVEVGSTSGVAIAYLTTTHPPVLSWAASTIDAYRDRGEPVTAADLGA